MGCLLCTLSVSFNNSLVTMNAPMSSGGNSISMPWCEALSGPFLSADVLRSLFLGCSLFVILYGNLQQGKFNQTGKTKSQILLSYFLMIQSRTSSLTCGNCSTPAALQINGGAKSNTPFQQTTPTFAIVVICFPIFLSYFCIDAVQTSPHYAINIFTAIGN